jgi:hypothetical protein
LANFADEAAQRPYPVRTEALPLPDRTDVLPGEGRLDILEARVRQGRQLWNQRDESGDERDAPLRVSNGIQVLRNGEFGAERVDAEQLVRDNLARLRQFSRAVAEIREAECVSLPEARRLAVRAFGLDGLAWQRGQGPIHFVGYFGVGPVRIPRVEDGEVIWREQIGPRQVTMGLGRTWPEAFSDARENLRAAIWRKEHQE